jgi:GTP pyrophosphokinase
MNQPSSPASHGSDLLTGLLGRIAAARPDADTGLITRAYAAAAYWHEGQQRRSGDPHITHPVAVAEILAEADEDDQTLCAALLHDVVDDTPCTLAALRQEFGEDIAGLVAAVMALDAAPAEQVTAACTSGEAAVALAGDRRALVIKVADRLHNIRTLRHLPHARQLDKSRQTLDVVVPLARTLGMDAIGAELQSLASATLQQARQRPGTASGHLLAASTALLPTAARARWREEWLAELQMLPTRRERLRFAMQIVAGIGRLVVTLYQPGGVLRQGFSAVLTAAVAASGLVVGGWRAAMTMAAAAVAVLGAVIWVLRNDDRTHRLTELIHAVRAAPASPARPAPRDPDPGTQR